MPNLLLNGEALPLAEGETVLDCLLRHGRNIAWSCRSGICQSCLVQAVDAAPPTTAQGGLKPSLAAAGYALACSWKPAGDVRIRLPDAESETVPVELVELSPLNRETLRARLRFCEEGRRFDSRPGQYLSLVNPQGLTRSYSIASDEARDGYLELHIAQVPLGAFTGWLFGKARVGQVLRARGAAGDCFYLGGDDRDYPILLAGTGTGLAPLYGIAVDALGAGHRGPITLLHGASRADRLYYQQELRDLARLHDNFSYRALTLEPVAAGTDLCQGDLNEAALSSLDGANLASTRVYLCGAPEFVQGLRKRIFMKGVRSANIHCDAFVMRKVEAVA